MGTALEVLGLALPYSSGIPAAYPGKSAHFPEEPKLTDPQRRLKNASGHPNT